MYNSARAPAFSLVVASSLLLVAAPSIAHAQSQAQSQAQAQPDAVDLPDATVPNSTVIYDQAYFAPLGPVTLEDMIRNIPGGISLLRSLRRNSGDRGFGSDGPPLLIDGRRMSGKSNDILTRLARIPADQVERIELIRGNAEGLDIRSDGIIYNVILKQSAGNASSNFIDARLNYVRGAPLAPQILLSHSGTKDGFEYGISYQFENDPRISFIREDVLDGDRIRYQFRDLTRTNIEKTHTLTGNIGYEFPAGPKIRLNGLYTENARDDFRDEDQFLVGPADTLNFFALEQARFIYADQIWELGGDVESNIGILGTLKGLFVVTRQNNDDSLSQDLLENGIETSLFSQLANFDEGETIFRTTITTPIGDRHSLEYGGEAAFNTLDTTFSFNGGPFENSIVEEDRYEIFLSHNFKITDKLNLLSGATGEFSTIFQNRDGVSNSRSFRFLKPRVELRYDLTPSDQLRLFAERTASQLDLNDFIASRNINDELINFGNPDLSPEVTWRYSAGYEKRFPNDAGTVKIEAFYESISDHIDKILIGTAASGIGNIGDARSFGVETEVSTRFGFIGLPNAVLTVQYEYENSEATDPFTGETRQISRRTPHYFDLDFRHDVNAKFTYGFNGHRRTLTRRQDVSLREITRYNRHVEVYTEYNITPTMKLRFTAHRFLGDARTFDKTFYVGNIIDGVIDRVDFQSFSIKTEYDIRFQATF